MSDIGYWIGFFLPYVIAGLIIWYIINRLRIKRLNKEIKELEEDEN